MKRSHGASGSGGLSHQTLAEESSAPPAPPSSSLSSAASVPTDFIASIKAATAAARAKTTPQDRDKFLNELIVWRESAIHFALAHQGNYDDYSVIEEMAPWAAKSMQERMGDRPQPPPPPATTSSSSKAASASSSSSALITSSAASISTSSLSLPPYLTKWLPSPAPTDNPSASPSTGLFTLKQLEMGATSDPYWNAAQIEMLLTGRMHGYLRMYWAKRINEWCYSPQLAHSICVYLNDRYQLDGRDANGYLGIAWCFGVFDRPMGNGPIIGSVRPMTSSGLTGKFNIGTYIGRIKRLMGECKCPRTRALLPSESVLFAPTSSSSYGTSGSGSGHSGNSRGGGGRGGAVMMQSITNFFGPAVKASPSASAAAPTLAPAAAPHTTTGSASTGPMAAWLASSSQVAGHKRKAPDGVGEEIEERDKEEDDDVGASSSSAPAKSEPANNVIPGNAFAELMKGASNAVKDKKKGSKK
jgi:uncharacterized membrane protein YgcG